MAEEDSYILCTGVPPKPFEFNHLIWDPVEPYLYINSQFNFPDNSYIYQYDRRTFSLVQAQQTINPWAPFGRPAVGLDRKLYFSPPGGTTHSSQFHGAFKIDDEFKFINAARRDIAGVCQQVSETSGGYYTDLLSQSQYWWHVSGADLEDGKVTAYSQVEYCNLQNPNTFPPKWKYAVGSEEMSNLSGFQTSDYVYRDGTPDGSGNFWVYQSGNNGQERHGLWRINGAGIPEFVIDLASAFPGPTSVSRGWLRWYRDEDALIVCNGVALVKYSIGSNTVTGALDISSANFTIAAGSNYASFHHPDHRIRSIWIADTVVNTSVPRPPGTTARFPRFTEIRMNDMQIGRQKSALTFANEYPDMGVSFTAPQEGMFDPETGGLWTSFRTNRHIAVFFFVDVPPTHPPNPGPGGGGEPGNIDNFCLPKNTEFDATANANQLGTSTLVQLNPKFTNTKKL